MALKGIKVEHRSYHGLMTDELMRIKEAMEAKFGYMAPTLTIEAEVVESKPLVGEPDRFYVPFRIKPITINLKSRSYGKFNGSRANSSGKS